MNRKIKYLWAGLFLICIPLSAQRKKSKENIPTEPIEEQFVKENFKRRSPSTWKPGERFVYTSPTLNITLKREKPITGDSTDYTNQILVFDSFAEKTDWVGNSTMDLRFDLNGEKIRFSTGKNLEQFSDTTYNPLIPGLILLSEIEKADSLLKGRQLYILTSEWESNNEEDLLEAQKLIPIEITAVKPGNEYFPVRIFFKNQNGKEFSILTVLSGTLNSSSRLPFHKIFSFSDPRLNHKDISDDVWDLITKGKVKEGMTQPEVRLSIGKPTEINRIPTYSGLKEQWFYNSGMMLFFEDGKVSKFRK